jgi:hypothetical protein
MDLEWDCCYKALALSGVECLHSMITLVVSDWHGWTYWMDDALDESVLGVLSCWQGAPPTKLGALADRQGAL